MPTLAEMDRELQGLRRQLDAKVGVALYRAEVDAMKTDIEKLEQKMDRMLESQITSQRTQILQLGGIIITLLVAAWGALA